MSDVDRTLRQDRNELSVDDLSDYERKERAWKLEKYRQWAAETDFLPSVCARRNALLLEWGSHNDEVVGRRLNAPALTVDEGGDTLHSDDASWTSRQRLIDHATHCPQCVVFPVPVPYLTADGLAKLKDKI